MANKTTLANTGSYIFGAAIMLAMLSLPVIFIAGGVWLGERVLPWLMLLSMIAVGFCVVILLPLTVFRATRGWAGVGFFFASFVFGLTGWFMGLLLALALWGVFAVIIGLFFCGIGVVPIAMLATLFNGMWLELGVLVLAVILTLGSRILGLMLADSV